MNSAWYLENDIIPDISVGIDEVGRGPLAGPVVAAAVWISSSGIAMLENSELPVRDSKKLSFNQREKVVQWINAQPSDIVKYAIGEASVQEIDSKNILQATFLAMQRAHSQLDAKDKVVLVDGNKAPEFGLSEVITVVKGDNKVVSISLASIIAKQHRDRIMVDLAKKYPNYGWENNVGYGTHEHICAILRYGSTPHHRKSFAPVKDLDTASQNILNIVEILSTPEPKSSKPRVG